MASDPKTHIVRPFGLIGGDYEVDAAGLRKYRISHVVAVITVAVVISQHETGIPSWLAAGAGAVGLISTFTLSAEIVRKGRKI